MKLYLTNTKYHFSSQSTWIFLTSI